MIFLVFTMWIKPGVKTEYNLQSTIQNSWTKEFYFLCRYFKTFFSYIILTLYHSESQEARNQIMTKRLFTDYTDMTRDCFSLLNSEQVISFLVSCAANRAVQETLGQKCALALIKDDISFNSCLCNLINLMNPIYMPKDSPELHQILTIFSRMTLWDQIIFNLKYCIK